jgi:hypothetical protein
VWWQIHSGEGGGGGGVGVVQALDGDGAVAVDLNAVAEATLNHDGQIILTGEDGHGTHACATFYYCTDGSFTRDTSLTIAQNIYLKKKTCPSFFTFRDA